ncbi:hypothetical protein KCP70_08740 [Salmonella enterica subsp. enterica]|nr:hypothetical protein KCP70_08740 [Salmonella enterica subsp. enterica]
MTIAVRNGRQHVPGICFDEMVRSMTGWSHRLVLSPRPRTADKAKKEIRWEEEMEAIAKHRHARSSSAQKVPPCCLLT